MSTSAKYTDVHISPSRPGDARPTALAIVQDEGLVGKLTDKVILITGCTSGIGLETAKALHATGAHLFITGRDAAKGEAAVQEIIASEPFTGKVELLHLDLDSLQSVRDCAAEFLAKSNKLNILITNAGVMACPEGTTKDGFETQFGTNHLAHFLLFQLLKPTLLASSTADFNSRVVALSSGAHRVSPVHLEDLDLKKMGYNPWVAYGQSKSANIHMVTEIERRYGAQGLHAWAVHPGVIQTSLVRHLSPEALGAIMTPELAKNSKSPPQGAATTVWAAVSKELEGKGGKYLENCSIAPLCASAEPKPSDPGFREHAYDEDTAKRLWDVSLKLVDHADEST